MKFRKPTKEDYNGDGDEMLCWRWFIFEIWLDLNYDRYELRAVFTIPMRFHFFLQRTLYKFISPRRIN